MNALALFAGICGFERGIRAGIPEARTVCYVEQDEYCVEVIRARIRDGFLDDAPIWGDIRSFDGHPWAGSVGCVCGGFPCQDLSLAGRGDGLAGERSGLWWEMLRVVREVGPGIVLIENVPGLFSSRTPPCVRGWPSGRRGLREYPGTETQEEQPLQRIRRCGYEREGAPSSGADEGLVRGECHTSPSGHGTVGTELQLAYRRGQGGILPTDNLSVSDAETATGESGGCVERDDCRSGSQAQRAQDMDGDGTSHRTDVQVADERPQCAVVAGADSLDTIAPCGVCEWTVGDGSDAVGRAIGTVLGSLAEVGYDASWRCLSAAALGAPHKRERIWIVAHARYP